MHMTVQEAGVAYTALTVPQLQLIESVTEFLPFVDSLTGQSSYVFTASATGNLLVFGTDNDALGILHKDKPTLLRPYEISLWHDMLQTGKPITGYIEQLLGALVRMIAFPIVDNGGKCIGGLAFVNNSVAPDSEPQRVKESDLVAETAYMTALAPKLNGVEKMGTGEKTTAADLYHPLSYQDGIIIFDEAGIILYANEAASRLVDLMGFDRRLVGTSVYGGRLKMSWVKEAIRNHRGAVSEEFYGAVIVEQTILPVSAFNRSKRSILLLRDRTALRRKEQELAVKNSVIKEIHHRVKNNLQTVAGLLRMEARRSDNPEVRQALQEGISRIESMALVHEAVSHYDEDYINLRTIAEELIRLLTLAMVPKERHIYCEYDGEDIMLSSHTVGYVSLVLNELLSNCLEHGFGNDRDGHVLVKASTDADGVLLTVSDDGKGLPDEFDLRKSKRLGLQIIRNLVENELQGTVTIEPAEDGGTVATVRFAGKE